VIAVLCVIASEEHAPAQAPPLSTAAPVAMVINNKARRVATLVPVRLLLLFNSITIIRNKRAENKNNKMEL